VQRRAMSLVACPPGRPCEVVGLSSYHSARKLDMLAGAIGRMAAQGVRAEWSGSPHTTLQPSCTPARRRHHTSVSSVPCVLSDRALLMPLCNHAGHLLTVGYRRVRSLRAHECSLRSMSTLLRNVMSQPQRRRACGDTLQRPTAGSTVSTMTQSAGFAAHRAVVLPNFPSLSSSCTPSFDSTPSPGRGW